MKRNRALHEAMGSIVETEPSSIPPARPAEAVLIVNTNSRRGRENFRAAKAGLAARGITVTQAHSVKRPKRLKKLVHAIIDAGHPLIIIGGGDGTISSLTGAFAHRDATLGVLPLGTGNSFVQSLEIPQTLDGALDVIASGHVARVDLGVVNGTYFANSASIGLSANVARRTPKLLKRIIGPVAYLMVGTALTIRNDAVDVEIDDGTSVQRMPTHQIIVNNGRIFGASPLVEKASLRNGRLALVILKGKHRWQIAKMWLAFLRGGLDDLEDAACFMLSQFTLRTSKRLVIDVDGEVVGTTPATFSTAAGALRICVPAGFTERQTAIVESEVQPGA